ncbi:MAG TPA: VWA domain-containing protein, partial [Methanocella sp.]|nr:VWA domain-containing protein [Methanocella sp.]
RGRAGGQRALAEKIAASQAALPAVELPEDIYEMIARISVDLGVDGHRADIVMAKTVAAIAAFRGSRRVGEEDVKEAAELVYPHRMRRNPFDEPAGDREISEAIGRNSQSPGSPQASSGEGDRGSPPPDGGDAREHTFPIGPLAPIRPVIPRKGRGRKSAQGRRAGSATATTAGVYVRSEPFPPGETDVAFDATLRAAAPHQYRRERGETAVVIERGDLRKKVRARKVGTTILFVVDASGSMGARRRMESAKGAVMSLLVDAYQHRDRVGMIVFRGEGPDVLLAPTASVELAKKGLEMLPTGGKTPLAGGLVRAMELIRAEAQSNPDSRPVVVLITDGKANVPLKGGDPLAEALDVARAMAEEGLAMMVIDTESDFVNLGLARTVAEAAGAQYVKLGEVTAGEITGAVLGSGMLG